MISKLRVLVVVLLAISATVAEGKIPFTHNAFLKIFYQLLNGFDDK